MSSSQKWRYFEARQTFVKLCHKMQQVSVLFLEVIRHHIHWKLQKKQAQRTDCVCIQH